MVEFKQLLGHKPTRAFATPILWLYRLIALTVLNLVL